MYNEFATYYYNGEPTKYLISNSGLVYSLVTNRFIKTTITNGYERCTIYINGKPKALSIHRMVAETFLVNDDPENKTHVDHVNGCKLDNFEDFYTRFLLLFPVIYVPIILTETLRNFSRVKPCPFGSF